MPGLQRGEQKGIGQALGRTEPGAVEEAGAGKEERTKIIKANTASPGPIRARLPGVRFLSVRFAGGTDGIMSLLYCRGQAPNGGRTTPDRERTVRLVQEETEKQTERMAEAR